MIVEHTFMLLLNLLLFFLMNCLSSILPLKNIRLFIFWLLICGTSKNIFWIQVFLSDTHVASTFSLFILLLFFNEQKLLILIKSNWLIFLTWVLLLSSLRTLCLLHHILSIFFRNFIGFRFHKILIHIELIV